MQWRDEGYLLSKNNYSENSVIIEVFTLNHGKCPGIVYVGTSRKIKNYLQLGNKIHVKYKIWICAATLMWGATCFLSFSIGYHYEYIHYNCSDTVIRDF